VFDAAQFLGEAAVRAALGQHAGLLQDGLQACSKIGVVFDDEHPHQRSPSSSMGWPLYASTCTSMLRPALSCNSTS